MDFSIMVYAVIALVGVAIGWLFASYQHAQQKAEQLAEREEMVAELSAAKQQITQSEHWRAECELLNNEVRSLQSINTSLEADLREVTTRMEAAQQHADDKIRQMINSEQRLSEQFENLANRIFEHSNRRVDEQHTVTRCNTEQGNETDDSRNTDFSCCNHQSKYTTDQCQRKIQQDDARLFHAAELIIQ